MTCTRRTFVNRAAAVLATAGGPRPARSNSAMNTRIASVETFPILYPTVGRFKFFEGPRGQPAGPPGRAGEDHGRQRRRRLGPERADAQVELRDARVRRLDHPPPPGARADRARPRRPRGHSRDDEPRHRALVLDGPADLQGRHRPGAPRPGGEAEGSARRRAPGAARAATG